MTSHPSDRPVSALRARMIADMSVRGFSEKTRNDYIRNVRAFAGFIGRSPDTATAEDLRRFQHHQARTGVRPPSINSAVAALRFFFTVTLDRPHLVRRLTIVREPRRLPAVLSVEEVTLLLQAAPGRIAAAGLAVSWPQPNRAALDPSAQPRCPRRRRDRRNQEAGVAAHTAAQLCHTSAGTGHRHPCHPGAARSRQARYDGTLHARRHHHDPHGDQPARPARAADRREAGNRGVARRPCAARAWRSRRSFITMGPPGARPTPDM